jgi:hypothetical protein
VCIELRVLDIGNSLSGQIQAPAGLLTGKEPLVSIRQKAGFAAEPVWTTWTGQIPDMEYRAVAMLCNEHRTADKGWYFGFEFECVADKSSKN